jgi:hypothetical protein
MSRRYTTSPSSVLGIEDEYVAFCINEVCAYFGSRADEDDYEETMDRSGRGSRGTTGANVTEGLFLGKIKGKVGETKG